MPRYVVLMEGADPLDGRVLMATADDAVVRAFEKALTAVLAREKKARRPSTDPGASKEDC